MRRTLDWLGWFDNYVGVIPDGLLYKYEDFASGNYESLSRHLGITIKGKARIPRGVERVARTMSFGNWRHWFTEQDVLDHKTLLVPWLEKYGYDAEDWSLAADPRISPAHCSEYFMRLVEEQRQEKGNIATTN